MLGNHRKYYYDYLHDTKQSPRVIFWNCFVHRLTDPDKDDYLTAELTLISQMIIRPSLPLFNQYQEYICTIILPEGYFLNQVFY